MDSSRFCGIICREQLSDISSNQEETDMDATTIAVDLAKSVFELALANAAWRIIGRRRLTRPQFERFLATQPAAHLVMEACGTAHHWARVARVHGHRVTLLPAQYVRPYVRRHKTDRTDAEALLEAVRSGRIDPVTVKTVAQQELQALHRVRAEWTATRTARINAMRGFLQEHGLTISRGARTALATIPTLLEDADVPIPTRLRAVLADLLEDVRVIDANLAALERNLAAIAEVDPVVQRLMTIPGIGLITSTALVATVGHIHGFRGARRFASWLGLTPSERSSAHRRRLGAISKMGDVYLRCLLTHGARAVVLAAHRAQGRRRTLTRLQQWSLAVQGRRGHNKATVAVANKLARIVWAVWSRDVAYEDRPALPAAA
jgi:transposase